MTGCVFLLVGCTTQEILGSWMDSDKILSFGGSGGHVWPKEDLGRFCCLS